MKRYEILVLHEEELHKTVGVKDVWRSNNVFVEKKDGTVVPYKERWNVGKDTPNPKILVHLPPNPSFQLDNTGSVS